MPLPLTPLAPLTRLRIAKAREEIELIREITSALQNSLNRLANAVGDIAFASSEDAAAAALAEIESHGDAARRRLAEAAHQPSDDQIAEAAMYAAKRDAGREIVDLFASVGSKRRDPDRLPSEVAAARREWFATSPGAAKSPPDLPPAGCRRGRDAEPTEAAKARLESFDRWEC